MSIVPMNQSTSKFDPLSQAGIDYFNARKAQSKALQDGIAGALDIARIATPGPNVNTRNDYTGSQDPATAIIRFLYKLGVFGGEDLPGTQVYSTDAGSSQGYATPKPKIDTER